MAAKAQQNFFSRSWRNIATSFRLTVASLKLVMAHPKVLLLPLATCLVVMLLVMTPLSLLLWGLNTYPDATGEFFASLYWVTVAAAEGGNWEWAITSAIIETYLLWSLWMIPVLTAVLYFSAAGMHVATQQIKGQEPNIGAAMKVVNGSFGRIVALAAFNATVYTWVRYLVVMVIRPVPLVGRWLVGGLRLVLSAVSYLMLPILVYERAGATSAFKSAWRQVRKTWSGLLVGSGAIFVATYLLFEVFAWGVAQHVLGTEGAAILSIIAAAFLYALSTAVSAALRATLYWYATTGEVPPGFNTEQLPDIEERQSFTGNTIWGTDVESVPSHSAL